MLAVQQSVTGSRHVAARLFDELMAYVADEQDSGLLLSIRGQRKVLRATGAIRWGGDDADIEQDLVSGIADLDTYGALVWRAHAQEDLANHLVGQGRSEEAEPLLAAARTTYQSIGATRWLARLDTPVTAG
jgi:hypothetical protein